MLPSSAHAGCPKPRPIVSRWAAVFVWGVWGTSVLAALVYVYRYGWPYPREDDWSMVGVLAGEDALSFDWLWAPYNGHRLPLGKLTMVALYGVTKGDFRSGMFAYVVMLALVASGMMAAAKHVRGWTSYADAFFPLAIFWGDYGNMLIMFQIALVLPACLAGILLICIVRSAGGLSRSGALLAGSCLVLLALSGPAGIAYVAPLSLWLAYVGIRSWHRGAGSWTNSAILLLLVTMALVLTGLYFVEPIQEIAPRSDWHSVIRTGVQFLSMAFGGASTNFWPGTGWLFLVLLLAGFGTLLAIWFRRPQERVLVAGLFLFLVGSGVLALGVGFARAGFGYNAGLAGRYVVLAIPALCCLYYVSITLETAFRSLWQITLMIPVCLLLPLQVSHAYSYGRDVATIMEQFEQDLYAALPATVLAERHARSICAGACGHEDPTVAAAGISWVADSMRVLQRAGVGPFRRLMPDPSLHETPLTGRPDAWNNINWIDGAGHVTSRDPYLEFDLRSARFVYAIRVKCAFETLPDHLRFQVSWKKSKQNARGEVEGSYQLRLPARPAEWTLTIWVWDTIDQFRIVPAERPPCVFRLSEITLLVPPK